MSWKKLGLLLIAVMLMVIGCAVIPTNLKPAYLKLEPILHSYKDPALDVSKYKTFSVFPSSIISDETALKSGILEKQMLFALRNAFELHGYKFVELNQSPDFLVTIDGSAPYRETYVPPQTVTIPQWVPGQTITSYGTVSGSFNYNTYGSYSSQGWGTLSGTSNTTTYVPGHMTTQTYSRSGYYTGAFYPSITISVFDGKSLANLWTGSGVGCSHNSDFRISSQFVLSGMIRQFPQCPHRAQNYPRGSGYIGIVVAILTNDGNNYFPTIVRLTPNSPASKAGFKVKVHDMILAINGVPTQNKPLSEILPLLYGEADTEISMTLWRVGKKSDVSLVRSQRGLPQTEEKNTQWVPYGFCTIVGFIVILLLI